jgi:hypothetical protein
MPGTYHFDINEGVVWKFSHACRAALRGFDVSRIPASFVADTVLLNLLAVHFELNLNLGTITLTYDNPVTSSSIQTTRLRLQSMANVFGVPASQISYFGYPSSVISTFI